MMYYYLVIWRPLRKDAASEMKVFASFSMDEKNLTDVRNHVEANWQQRILDDCGPGRIEVVKSNPDTLFWIE